MEYESTQFFSDIGGAAGLILGVSLNAFFGIAGATKAICNYWKHKQFRNNNVVSESLMVWSLGKMKMRWMQLLEYNKRNEISVGTQT